MTDEEKRLITETPITINCFEDKKWYKAYDTAFEFPSKNIVAWCYSPTYKE